MIGSNQALITLQIQTNYTKYPLRLELEKGQAIFLKIKSQDMQPPFSLFMQDG
jgi:hypothetical protein